MSILIKGMEMPHDCEECKLCVIIPVGDYEILRKCVALNRRAEYVIRRKDCPLVELPPHGRLIDADEISKHKYATIPPYRKEYSDGKPKSEDEVIAFKFGWNDAIDAIVANAPTIIEAEGGGI